jgi:hypothetical protein
MAEPTILMHASALAQALPPIAAGLRRSRSPAHQAIVLGCAVSIAADAIQLLLSRQGINNFWVSYTFTPLAGAAFLFGLAAWQLTYLERLTLRLAIPIYVVAHFTLVLLTEDVRHFSSFVGPLHSLILLIAALWTLVRRSFAQSEQPHLQSDWFWVAGGLAIYGAASAAFGPVASILMRDRVDLVVAAINVRSALYILSFTAIAWGVQCRHPAKLSGPSLSPPRSA